MRYRTKLILAFILLALITNGALTCILSLRTRGYLKDEIRSKILTIAQAAAAAVDPELHESIQSEADMAGAAYRELVARLREVRDANRRQDVHVRFLYTMRPESVEARLFRFVLDAEEDESQRSTVNEIYRVQEAQAFYPLDRAHAQENFSTDAWGNWLSATAPIRDSHGRTVALAGVDLAADDVLARLRTVYLIGAGGLLISLTLACVLAWLLALRATRPLLVIRDAVREIGSGKLETCVRLSPGDEFAEVGEAVNAMALGLQQRDNLKGALARYVSEEVAESIVSGGQTGELKGERKKITILFADVRGFTSLSERFSPEEIVDLLNTYFERMIEAIFRHQGYLNKFMGDGLMAVFGATREDPYQEEHAIRAALDMREALARLRDEWAARHPEHKVELAIGIGINTGVAVVGNIGSRQKMEFTAIGDSVNLASRLESATKDFPDTDILVSEYTFVAVRSTFPFQSCGEVRVKGKAEPVKTYTLRPPASPSGPPAAGSTNA